MVYVALLRGINVGGKSLIKMAELRECVQNLGFDNVKTYINSGNIIFKSDEKNSNKIADEIKTAIKKTFNHEVPVVVLSKAQLQKAVSDIPSGWGENPEWKYNYLFLLPTYDPKEALELIGELKPEIEQLAASDGLIYQSISIKRFGSATSGKIAGKPVYKQITIRNNRTPVKILELMKDYD